MRMVISCTSLKRPLIFISILSSIFARVAELVDAHGSGPCVRKNVLVQLQSRVRNIILSFRVSIASGMNNCRGCIPIYGRHSQSHSAALYDGRNSSLMSLS